MRFCNHIFELFYAFQSQKILSSDLIVIHNLVDPSIYVNWCGTPIACTKSSCLTKSRNFPVMVDPSLFIAFLFFLFWEFFSALISIQQYLKRSAQSKLKKTFKDFSSSLHQKVTIETIVDVVVEMKWKRPLSGDKVWKK